MKNGKCPNCASSDIIPETWQSNPQAKQGR